MVSQRGFRSGHCIRHTHAETDTQEHVPGQVREEAHVLYIQPHTYTFDLYRKTIIKCILNKQLTLTFYVYVSDAKFRFGQF